MQDVKIIFAQNLIALRKQMKLTQVDLADKINYSDKAVSKWERGESIPDVTVLMSIAALFGVTLDFLVSEHDQPEIAAEQTDYAKKVKKKNHAVISAITLFAIIAAETIVFAVLQSVFKQRLVHNLLYCYVFPLPLVAIVALVFSSLWGRRIYCFWAITGLLTSLCLDAFLIAYVASKQFFPWIFLILVPAELITMLSFKIIRLSK